MSSTARSLPRAEPAKVVALSSQAGAHGSVDAHPAVRMRRAQLAEQQARAALLQERLQTLRALGA